MIYPTKLNMSMSCWVIRDDHGVHNILLAYNNEVEETIIKMEAYGIKPLNKQVHFIDRKSDINSKLPYAEFVIVAQDFWEENYQLIDDNIKPGVKLFMLNNDDTITFCEWSDEYGWVTTATPDYMCKNVYLRDNDDTSFIAEYKNVLCKKTTLCTIVHVFKCKKTGLMLGVHQPEDTAANTYHVVINNLTYSITVEDIKCNYYGEEGFDPNDVYGGFEPY